jgi:hypothetical protein
VFLAEPQRTAYDVNFQLFGVPVRIHPFFWLAMVLLGTGPKTTPQDALVWVVAAFLSILVHEFGHVAAIAYYGSRSRIVLHAFGGLAIQDSNWRRRPPEQIVISLAGPAAGFLFAALVVLLVRLGGSPVDVRYFRPIYLFFLHEPFEARMLNLLIQDLWFANIYWGILNLLPIYPLDGGQASAALFQLHDSGDGLRKALTLSFGVAVLMTIYAFLNFGGFSGIFFGYLAYQNYQLLQGLRGGYRGSPW